jgi:hypothetical protein
VLTISKGGILGRGVALILSSILLPHLRVIFHCKTLVYQNLNQNYNILYSEQLFYGLYACTYIFLLRRIIRHDPD